MRTPISRRRLAARAICSRTTLVTAVTKSSATAASSSRSDGLKVCGQHVHRTGGDQRRCGAAAEQRRTGGADIRGAERAAVASAAAWAGVTSGRSRASPEKIISDRTAPLATGAMNIGCQASAWRSGKAKPRGISQPRWWRIVDPDHMPDDVGAPAEGADPQSMAEDDDLRRVTGRVRRDHQASERRSCARSTPNNDGVTAATWIGCAFSPIAHGRRGDGAPAAEAFDGVACPCHSEVGGVADGPRNLSDLAVPPLFRGEPGARARSTAAAAGAPATQTEQGGRRGNAQGRRRGGHEREPGLRRSDRPACRTSRTTSSSHRTERVSRRRSWSAADRPARRREAARASQADIPRRRNSVRAAPDERRARPAWPARRRPAGFRRELSRRRDEDGSASQGGSHYSTGVSSGVRTDRF